MRFAEDWVFEKFPYQRHDVFIDVGANVGMFSKPFIERGWPVIAFEPHPQLFARLQQQWGDRPNVVLVQKAVADEPGELPFYTSDTHEGIHSLAAFHPTHEATTVVEVTTLADELDRLDVGDVTVLKIDVEGADFLALKGFDFEHRHPELTMVEFMDDRSSEHFGYTHHDMAEHMEQFGYLTMVSEWAPLTEYARPGQPSPHRWRGLHRYDPSGSPAHGNLLFIQPEREATLMRVARRVAAMKTSRDVLLEVPGVKRTAKALLRPFRG